MNRIRFDKVLDKFRSKLYLARPIDLQVISEIIDERQQ